MAPWPTSHISMLLCTTVCHFYMSRDVLKTRVMVFVKINAMICSVFHN